MTDQFAKTQNSEPQLSEKELRDQRAWDRYLMSLHASSTLSWFDCISATMEKMGLRPGGMDGDKWLR